MPPSGDRPGTTGNGTCALPAEVRLVRRPGDPEDPFLTASVPFDHARGKEVVPLEALRGVLVPDVQEDSLAEIDT